MTGITWVPLTGVLAAPIHSSTHHARGDPAAGVTIVIPANIGSNPTCLYHPILTCRHCLTAPPPPPPWEWRTGIRPRTWSPTPSLWPSPPHTSHWCQWAGTLVWCGGWRRSQQHSLVWALRSLHQLWNCRIPSTAWSGQCSYVDGWPLR